MFRFWCLVVLCSSAAWSSAADAGAQEPPPEEARQAATASVSPSYLEYRKQELAHLARRSRVGLISTSAATAVGAAIVAPALAGQCVRVASSSSYDDLRCTTTGKTLLGVGVPILVAGATGLLITAIMYGVRRGKARNIDTQLEYERRHSVHWDRSRAALSF